MSTQSKRYNSKSERLVEQLSADIRRGVFPAGIPLPPDTVLAERYAVARNTFIRAVNSLRERGEVVRDSKKKLWATSNVAAPSLQTVPGSQTTRIGIHLGGTYDRFFFELMEGIGEACRERGLQFYRIPYSSYTEAVEELHSVVSSEFDGLIVASISGKEFNTELNALVESGLPVVAVDRQPVEFKLPIAKSDHMTAAYSGTTTLLERFERPVYFFGHGEPGSSVLDELEGYKRAMFEAGYGNLVKAYTHLAVFVPHHVPLDNLEQCWRATTLAALEWLPKLTMPVSIFAGDDYIARGVYEAAEHLKLSIGKDIAIIGIGNLPFSRTLNPPLATFAHQSVAIGYECVRMLMNIISGKCQTPASVYLPMRFEDRISCRLVQKKTDTALSFAATSL